MKVLHCPRCGEHSLTPTGAFWACGNCGYAITQAALCAEEAGAEGRGRQATGRRARGYAAR